MSEPRESMTAFVTSDVLDHDGLHAFLAAATSGGSVRWRGMCWQILEHTMSTETGAQHSFRLASVPEGDCS